MKIKPQPITLLFSLLFLIAGCKKDKEDKYYLKATINGISWEAEGLQILTTGILPDNDPIELIGSKDGEKVALRFNNPGPGSFPFRPGGSNDVLPAVLISFTVSFFESGHKIEWTTGLETDTRDFIIESSADGLNWTAIQTIPANGIASDYSYIVTDIIPARSYYRLKQVDTDDRFSYSAVLVINNASYPAYYQPANDNPRRGYEGNLQITRIDRSEREMEGSFLFKIKATDGTLYTITDGKFRIRY